MSAGNLRTVVVSIFRCSSRLRQESRHRRDQLKLRDWHHVRGADRPIGSGFRALTPLVVVQRKFKSLRVEKLTASSYEQSDPETLSVCTKRRKSIANSSESLYKLQ